MVAKKGGRIEMGLMACIKMWLSRRKAVLVGNELVHAGSHARPQAVDRGIPSQGGSTE